MKREELPEKVRDRLSKIEAELGIRASVLRVYKGFFYAYSYENAISKSTGKSKSIVRYIGKLDANGSFMPVKSKPGKASLQEAAINPSLNAAIEGLRQRYIRIAISKERGAYNIYDVHDAKEPRYICTLDADGREIESPGTETEQAEESKQNNLDKIDMTILRCLSMNAKMPLNKIAKLAGTTTASVFYRKRALEKEYEIRYFAEADLYELKYSMYMCFIKFEENVPSAEALRIAFSKEPTVQLVLLTKGDYDVILYMLAKSSNDITNVIFRLRRGMLIDYKAQWYLTTYNDYYGYVPLRDEFFDLIEEEQVWQKSKDEPRKPKDKITYTEYIVLRELNTNGDSEFSEIAERYKLKPQAVQYAYHALKEKYKFITRMTMSMNNLPVKYNAVLFMNIKDMKAFQETRKNLMLNVIEEYVPSSKYLLEGDIELPYGVIFFAPIYKESEFSSLTNDLIDNVKGIEVRNAIITEVVIGRLCYRLFDNMYSMQYKRLVETYKLRTYKGLINYDDEQYEDIIYRERTMSEPTDSP
ncbi:MAG: hypothetical protein QXL94_09360 [Candidatus Parvarchaeum sp.]